MTMQSPTMPCGTERRSPSTADLAVFGKQLMDGEELPKTESSFVIYVTGQPLMVGIVKCAMMHFPQLSLCN